MLKSKTYLLRALVFVAGVLLYSNGAMAAGAPTQLLIAAGDNQTTPAGTRVPGVVCVQVRDANNVPVPGINVTWGAVTGGGSLTNPVETTNSIGIATLGAGLSDLRRGSTPQPRPYPARIL